MPTVTEIWNRRGSVDERGRYSFTRRFYVLAENRKVSQKQILASLAAAPWNIYIGRVWQIGSVGDSWYETSNVYCTRIECECVAEEDGVGWRVDATWEPGDPNLLGAAAISENPSANPIRLSWGQWSESIAVFRDKNGNVIKNTAGDRFSEPVEGERHYPMLRIQRFERTFNQDWARQYRNTVNDPEFTIEGTTFPKRTVRCISITAEREFHQDFGRYYDVTYEFVMRTPPFYYDILGQPTQGWDIGVANIGYRYKNTDGRLYLITDQSGVPFPHPVPLNVVGQPLPIPLPDSIAMPMISFAVYDQKDFGDFGFPTT